MTVLEYLMKTKVHEITFIKARARKDAASPFYHPEYQTTPMYSRGEALNMKKLSDYIVLNDRQESITWLSGADWNIHIRKGIARCLLVISPEDFKTLYDESQMKHMIAYIDKKLKP